MAAQNIFRESYGYTKQYREFVKEMKKEQEDYNRFYNNNSN